MVTGPGDATQQGGPTGAFVRHPLAWGVGWSLVFGFLAVVALAADWPLWADATVLTLLTAPSLAATVVVLSATPRKHFDEMSSVFAHFFVRYAALVLAVVAWGGSVVVGAAISQTIQLAAEGREDEIVGVGYDIMAVIVPLLVALLWIGFVLRCSWFLAKVRGWREAPTTDGLPELLAAHPGWRRVVIGLAHPALFAATGLAGAIALSLAADGSTFELVID